LNFVPDAFSREFHVFVHFPKSGNVFFSQELDEPEFKEGIVPPALTFEEKWPEQLFDAFATDIVAYSALFYCYGRYWNHSILPNIHGLRPWIYLGALVPTCGSRLRSPIKV
jgi:hypothetical protein